MYLTLVEHVDLRDWDKDTYYDSGRIREGPQEPWCPGICLIPTRLIQYSQYSSL